MRNCSQLDRCMSAFRCFVLRAMRNIARLLTNTRPGYRLNCLVYRGMPMEMATSTPRSFIIACVSLYIGSTWTDDYLCVCGWPMRCRQLLTTTIYGGSIHGCARSATCSNWMQGCVPTCYQTGGTTFSNGSRLHVRPCTLPIPYAPHAQVQ